MQLHLTNGLFYEEYTLLLWFVNNNGSWGDLREAHGSRDVLISPDNVGSRKGSERKTK